MSKFIPRNKIITLDDEKLIIKKYLEGFSGPQIVKFLSKIKTTKTIYDILKKYNVGTREEPLLNNSDHFYFSSIDKPEKAYLLGLLITDGWVNTEKNEVGIQLQENDLWLIEWIKNQIQSPHKILRTTKGLTKYPNGKYYESSPMYRITNNSMKMVNDLKKYGITDKKTFITFFPILDFYQDCLLRGILDGDGSIYIHSNGINKCVRFIGSSFLIAGIGIYLTLMLKVSEQIPKQKESIFYIEWSKEEDVKKIVNFLYKEKTVPYLDRKRSKIENLLY